MACAPVPWRWWFSAGLMVISGLASATEESKPAPATPKEEPKIEDLKKDVQGPAITAPREIFEMLEQRKRLLDKRETALRGSETHLLELKAELEQIVTRHEQAVEAEKKRRQAAQAAKRVLGYSQECIVDPKLAYESNFAKG